MFLEEVEIELGFKGWVRLCSQRGREKTSLG